MTTTSGAGIAATPVAELDLPIVELLSVSRADQPRVMAQARQQHWLARSVFGYSVLNYDDCVVMLRDRRFESAIRLISRLAGLPDDHPLAERRRESILSMEGPAHDRLRRLVAPAFTPVAAERLRPFMRTTIERLVGHIAANGECELVADICEPYPIPIICELLGAPKEDWRLFSQWATDLLAVFNADLLADAPRILAARDQLDAYVTELIERRRGSPTVDLLTSLIAAEEAGDRLNTDELIMMAEAVLMAGTDTTRNQLACIVAVFAEHPEQWSLLAQNPGLAPRAIEEAMRYLGAVRGTARFASEDIVYRDILFPQGTLIFPSFVGANFDPSTWVEPDTFDITKAPAGQPHLTFGSGIHYCLGANLARAELQEALPVLAQRLPDLRLRGEVTWKPSNFGIWGPAALPLAFTPQRS